MATHRYLTKSRFTQGAECAAKLHYSGDRAYFDRRADDGFLQALAEGGFQVGALARLMVPGGVLVDQADVDAQLAHTARLLQRQHVVIYEATLAHEGKLVRVDVLRKRGRVVDLIEVKAKSYDAAVDGDFRSSRGGIRSAWRPYLLDIAFQHHVVHLALPDCELRPWLMLVDKHARASVDGLGQAFKVRRSAGGGVVVDVAPGTEQRLGNPLLIQLAVGDQVAEIQADSLPVGAAQLPFGEAVEMLASAGRGERLIAGVPSVTCGNCEFKWPSPPLPGGLRSGFHECWSRALGWTADDFAAPLVLDLWNSRRKAGFLARGLYKLAQLQADDLGLEDDEPGSEGLGIAQRQWMQCRRQATWLDADGLGRDMATWTYPLNFIDFETAMVPIPFQAGRRPYEVIAFQFSHHVMEGSGQVRHASQFIDAMPGVDPSRGFLRALMQALGQNEGTVFRWSQHENNVLNALRARLLEEAQPGDAELVDFIETLTHGGDRSAGTRDMVDLCAVAQRRYFAPSTRGSSSLKKVLPALMRDSALLRERYGRAVYGSAQMPSLNLAAPVAWWIAGPDGLPVDPYDLLPRVFDDLAPEVCQRLDDSLGNDLQDGGAAMAAYARLQQEELPASVRDAIESALLRYCELDTLAMVMAVQAWQEAVRS
ncbi:MAG TPA: DUF2779 domain-containing protein [Roseateles sp.]